MTSTAAVPIIVGVGDFKNKSAKVEDATEPAQLMVRAIRRAIADTGLGEASQKTLRLKADTLRVVPTWTWAYNDLPGIISDSLGIDPSHKEIGYHGGNQPALQCDEAARAIAARQSTVAILTGGEALASLAACQKAGQLPPRGWTEPDADGKQLGSIDMSILQDGVGTLHSMGLPIHVYPFYENGRRAAQGQTAQENNEESAAMYAAFDDIASKNEYSWNYGEPSKSAEHIGSVSKRNRIICQPYPLLMNAFNTVNLSAACVLTSTEYAQEIGIPQDRWIYVLGGAGTHEKDDFWERSHFHKSPAICRSIDAALDVSGLNKSQVDCFDFYSCFPIVPKLACDHLGLSTTKWQKPISLLGGLTSFGGAGNNYSMHAITAMSRQLRSGRYGTGLVLANGGMLTHQHALCLSAQPRQDGRGYPTRNPLPPIADDSSPAFVQSAEGPATIETYTIEFDRQGSPALGLIVGRLQNTGERFLANHANERTLHYLSTSAVEHIGQPGYVKTGEQGKNIFIFDMKASL